MCMDRSDLVELVERHGARRGPSRDDDVSLMRLDLLADAPEQKVLQAARNLAAGNRPVTLETLADAVLKPGANRVSRTMLQPTGRLLGTVGTPADGLVRRILTSAEEVRAAAKVHTDSRSLPLPFSLDRDSDVFCVDFNGWNPPGPQRRYVRPLTPLLFTIRSLVMGHRSEGRIPFSGRFYLHCGWVECAACRRPLAWLTDADDFPTAPVCSQTFATPAATIYHRNPLVHCPRPDCFCNARKLT